MKNKTRMFIECVSTFIEYEQLCPRNNGLAHFNASLCWQSQSLLATNKRFILPSLPLTFVYILLFFTLFSLNIFTSTFLRSWYVYSAFFCANVNGKKMLTFFPTLKVLLGMNMNTGTDCNWMAGWQSVHTCVNSAAHRSHS